MEYHDFAEDYADPFEMLANAVVARAAKDYRMYRAAMINLYPSHAIEREKMEKKITAARDIYDRKVESAVAMFEKKDKKYQHARQEVKELREYFINELPKTCDLDGKWLLKQIDDEINKNYVTIAAKKYEEMEERMFDNE